MAKRPSFDERLASNIERGEGCWLWRGARTKLGYGQIERGGQRLLGHRASYEAHVGPIPAGMCVLHRCDNPACVRPDHLFLGTMADNSADMIRKGRGRGQFAPKTRCDRGHPFTPDNTRMKKDGAKRCRLCARTADRERYRRLHRVTKPRGLYKLREKSNG